MSDFEEFARSQGFSGDFQRGCNGQYKSDLLHFMEKAFMHQQAEIDRLSSVLDERTKEWLQAIELGAYFENVAKPLKEENDRLKAQLNNMEACYIGKKKRVDELEGALNEVKDWKSHPVGYEASFGSWGVRDFYRGLAEKALRGES
jgi:hypothetical protein